MADVRTSKIRKSIMRKFNLGNYENMDVIVDQEHTIEWSSLQELMDKSANVTKLVTKDFKDTCSMVQEELEASEKKAFLGNYGTPKDEKGVLSGGLEEDDFDSL
jgi:hypothetical protein